MSHPVRRAVLAALMLALTTPALADDGARPSDALHELIVAHLGVRATLTTAWRHGDAGGVLVFEDGAALAHVYVGVARSGCGHFLGRFGHGSNPLPSLDPRARVLPDVFGVARVRADGRVFGCAVGPDLYAWVDAKRPLSDADRRAVAAGVRALRAAYVDARRP